MWHWQNVVFVVTICRNYYRRSKLMPFWINISFCHSIWMKFCLNKEFKLKEIFYLNLLVEVCPLGNKSRLKWLQLKLLYFKDISVPLFFFIVPWLFMFSFQFTILFICSSRNFVIHFSNTSYWYRSLKFSLYMYPWR